MADSFIKQKKPFAWFICEQVVWKNEVQFATFEILSIKSLINRKQANSQAGFCIDYVILKGKAL